MEDAPKATGSVIPVRIKGCIFPTFKGEPVLLRVPSSDFLYLPIFSTLEKFLVIFDKLKFEHDKIMKIDDTKEFLSSIPPDVKVAIDFRFTEKGLVRWFEPQEEGPVV